MGEEVRIPDNLNKIVLSVGPSMSSEEIDTYGKFKEIEDRSYKLKKILDAWERQHTEERKLRVTYAKYLLSAIFVQLVLVNLVLFLLGFGIIKLEQWMANIFVVSVFAEIVGMAHIILKYLFPKLGGEVLELLKSL